MLPSAVAMTEAIDLQEFEAPERSKKPTKGYTAKVFQALCQDVVATQCYEQESIMKAWETVTTNMNAWYVAASTLNSRLNQNSLFFRAIKNDHTPWQHKRLKAKFESFRRCNKLIDILQTKNGSKVVVIKIREIDAILRAVAGR